MIDCDNRPRYPSDRTVRGGRRPCDPVRPARPGRPKRLSDAELVCLAVAQVLLGARSEHHWLRLCYGRLGQLFPYLPKQPGYHKRLKAAAPLLAAAMDTWPASARRGRPAAAAGCHAGAVRYLPGDGQTLGSGRVGGLRVLRVAFALVLGAEAVPGHHRGRDAGRVVPGQPETRRTRGRRRSCWPTPPTGSCGRDDRARRQGLRRPRVRGPLTTGSACSWSPGPPRRASRHGNLGGVRQWIESVYDTLKGQLDLERHGGRTAAGVFTRVAQRLLAMAAAIWHNWPIDAPVKRSLIAYDH